MKKRTNRYLLQPGVFAVVLLFLSFGLANAQEFRGTITGSVKDQNGAIVPGATVTIENTATNVKSNATTNDEGAFVFPLLIPGNYKLSATANGFKTSVRESLELKVDDRLTIDFQLEIGAAAEVTVVAGEALIERGSVTTGTVISNRQVEELPLPEGAVFTLVTQAPGVAYTGNPQFQGPTANGNLASFRTNGAGGNQISLDGSPNFAFGGQVAFTPPSDAVQEFKVQTNSFDAQNGFTAGSTVNVALKSGTNKLHGSLYYFDRDKSRTANNFFSNRLGIERPDRKYFRYGTVINGPVFIPKIYDGRNRTFFLFSYERQKDNVAEPTTYTVPTERIRNGDFSELLPGTLIYNPATAVLAAGVVTRTAFAGNIIPQAQLNQAALAFARLFPTPNMAGTVNNFFTNQNLLRPYRSLLVKIDHNINGNNRIFGKYFWSKSSEDRYNLLQTADAVTRGFEFRTNNGGNFDYTGSITASSVLNIRLGFNQFRQERRPANPITPASIGFNALGGYLSATQLPRFDFRNYLTLGSLRADYNEGLIRPFSMISFQPNMTQIFGNHTFRYGYDFRLLKENSETNGFNAGRFFFDGTYTSPASNSSTALRNAVGRDFASFLLGIPVANTNSLIDNPTAYNVSSKYHGIFFQDDWRINSRLTVNLGLRYEFETGVTDSENRLVTGFDRTTVSPLQAAAQANFAASVPTGVPTPFNVVGGLLFADALNRANQKGDKNNFQPRLGISYSLDNKTVFRAGFGIFTAPFQIQGVNQAGFSTPTLFVPSTNNGLTFIANLTNPFPAGVAASPGSSLGLATFAGRDLITTNATGPTSVVLSNNRENAQFARFIFGVQRELPFKFGLEVTYVYSRGYNIAVNREINFVPSQYLNSGFAFDQATQTFLNASVPNPFRTLIPSSGTYNAATIQRRLLLVPFPQFGNVAVTEFNGNSTYSSLQIQIVKRFTRGVSFNSSYSYSTERERTQYLNPQDTELADFVSPTSRPHRFTFSGVYELPIGRGRWIGNDWNRWLDAFIGGWQLAANYEWQSGEPLLLGNVYFEGDPGQIVNLLGKKDGNGRRYGIDIPAFDITKFYPGGVVNTGNALIGLGNNYTIAGTNTLRYLPLTLNNFRNQRFLNVNFGLSKNFKIREGMKLQIRAEAINAFNDPYFSGLNLDPTNAAFGIANTQRQPPRDIQLGARFTF